MADYLHQELVRSLSNDDPSLLGPDYPGPLAQRLRAGRDLRASLAGAAIAAAKVVSRPPSELKGRRERLRERRLCRRRQQASRLLQTFSETGRLRGLPGGSLPGVVPPVGGSRERARSGLAHEAAVSGYRQSRAAGGRGAPGREPSGQGAPSAERELGRIAAAQRRTASRRSYDALGDGANAAVHYQKIYFKYPASAAEKEAAAGLERLREQLGDKYPPAMSADMFERADLLIQAKDYGRARKELETWASQFGGEDRELARVRFGAAGFLANETGTACAYLRSLASGAGEAEAERLYYLAECARHDDSDDAIAAALATLERDHARSPWRLKTLVRAGNRYLVRNQPARYAPYYRACYASFPSEVQAAHCHWKVAWSTYLARRADARAMLREHFKTSRLPITHRRRFISWRAYWRLPATPARPRRST